MSHCDCTKYIGSNLRVGRIVVHFKPILCLIRSWLCCARDGDHVDSSHIPIPKHIPGGESEGSHLFLSMTSLVFVLLLAMTTATRMRGSSKVETNGRWSSSFSQIAFALTATLSSNYDYEVLENPITVFAEFSSSPLSFEEENCIVVSVSSTHG